MSGPRNLVVVLLDSLCRHLIGPYGGREFDTPNLDRFARRAVRFDNHVTGSLPCMPARHDLLCGAYDFLWKPWGSIEAEHFRVSSQVILGRIREAGALTWDEYLTELDVERQRVAAFLVDRGGRR
jgi:arylsulfatase A-like enzyme